VIWRGEVYDVDLGHPVGHEPGFVRPAVVVSADMVNNGPGGLVVVVPITSTPYGLRSHIEIESVPNGLDHGSFARCDQLRVIAVERLAERAGALSFEELERIENALRFILDL